MHPRLVRAACVTATALATCALVAPAQAAPGGHGKGDHGSHAQGPKQDKVAKEIAKVDARLARVTKRVDRLDADDATAVTDNVSADRAELAGATSRSEVRAFRPEVYSWVVNALRKTTRLETGASADADTAAAVDAAHAALLGLRATSDRAQLRDAKRILAGATQAVDDLGDDDAADDEADDEADDQADDQGDDTADDDTADDDTTDDDTTDGGGN